MKVTTIIESTSAIVSRSFHLVYNVPQSDYSKFHIFSLQNHLKNTLIMKYLQILLLFGLLCFASCSEPQTEEKVKSVFTANPQPVAEQEVKTLDIGETAPFFNLPATDGKHYSIDDFQSAEALAIIFTCNHCPTAQAYEDRLISVVSDYKDKGVAFVAISPNSPLGLLYEELGYSDLNDDFEEMKIRVKDMKYNFTYYCKCGRFSIGFGCSARW